MSNRILRKIILVLFVVFLTGCMDNNQAPINSDIEKTAYPGTKNTVETSFNESLVEKNKNSFSDISEYYNTLKSFNIASDTVYNSEYKASVTNNGNLKSISEKNIDFDNLQINKTDISNHCDYPEFITSNAGKVLILDGQANSLEREMIMFDSNNNSNCKLEIDIEDDYTIYEIALDNNQLYYIEASKQPEEINTTWKIVKYDLQKKEYSIIDEAINYIETTLLPRIKVDNSKLIFLVGYKNQNKLKHIIKLYDSKIDQLSDLVVIKNVVNPYIIPRIHDNQVFFLDYDESGWFVIQYSLSTKIIKKYPIDLESDVEYIRHISIGSKYISIISSFNLLYVINCETGETIPVNLAHTAAMLNDYCIYSNNGKLYCYNPIDDSLVLLDDDKTIYYYYIDVFDNKIIALIDKKADNKSLAYYFEVVPAEDIN